MKKNIGTENKGGGEKMAGEKGRFISPLCLFVVLSNMSIASSTLGEKKTTLYFTQRLPATCILPDLSPSQVLQGGSATDGQKGGREGG